MSAWYWQSILSFGVCFLFRALPSFQGRDPAKTVDSLGRVIILPSETVLAFPTSRPDLVDLQRAVVYAPTSFSAFEIYSNRLTHANMDFLQVSQRPAAFHNVASTESNEIAPWTIPRQATVPLEELNRWLLAGAIYIRGLPLTTSVQDPTADKTPKGSLRRSFAGCLRQESGLSTAVPLVLSMYPIDPTNRHTDAPSRSLD